MATRRPPDSSEEEEATAIDLRSSLQALKALNPNAPGKPSSASSSAPSAASSSAASSSAASSSAASSSAASSSAAAAAGGKAPPQTMSKGASRRQRSSDDEDATEFLAMRPTSAASGAPGEASTSPSSLRARGRAVPLEGDEVSTPAAAAERSPAPRLVEKPDTGETPAIARPAPAPLPARTPRPLPGERQTNVKSETQTGSNSASSPKSAPRITRIVAEDAATHDRIVAPDEARTDPGEDDEITDPPSQRAAIKPRPLPGSADQIPNRRQRTARTSVPSSETVEAEPANGTLIVEVPDGAVVFVNGIERGVGPSLKVTAIDRYAKHAVRIHAPGYAPWSGTVSLEGRTAAKIRPGLKSKK